MAATRYWSVEECRWVDQPAPDELWSQESTLPMPLGLPQQRAMQPVEEPVEA